MNKQTEDHLTTLKSAYNIRIKLEEQNRVLNSHDKKLDQIIQLIEKLESSMSKK